MSSVCFVIPAHGRVELAEICLRQLRRTCDALGDATAVVVACDETLEIAFNLGFHPVAHPNAPLGAKWNTGYEVASKMLGPDYLVPFGSDDWIDPRLIAAQMDADGELRCSRLSAVVREDGQRLAVLRIPYDGGDGVRVIPRSLLKPLGYRPCDDHRDRGIDTSIMLNLTQHLGRRPEITYLDMHGTQIVDFKSPSGQLNTYAACLQYAEDEEVDPWDLLAVDYPPAAVAEVRALYMAEGALPAPRPPVEAPEVEIALTRDPEAFPREVSRLRQHGPGVWV